MNTATFSVGFTIDPAAGDDIIVSATYGASDIIGSEGQNWPHVIGDLTPEQAYQAVFAARGNWPTIESFRDEVKAIVSGGKKHGATPRNPEGDGHMSGSYKKISPASEVEAIFDSTHLIMTHSSDKISPAQPEEITNIISSNTHDNSAFQIFPYATLFDSEHPEEGTLVQFFREWMQNVFEGVRKKSCGTRLRHHCFAVPFRFIEEIQAPHQVEMDDEGMFSYKGTPITIF